MSEVPCHIINHWCSSLGVVLFISVHCDVTGTRNTFQRIYKCMKVKKFDSECWKKYYVLAHVMWCHRSMFTENHHFKIFGSKRGRNMMTTVISGHPSHAQGRWPVYFWFTNLKCHSNGHVTAATAHHLIIMLTGQLLEIVREIYISYYHFLTHALMPVLSSGFEKQIKLLICVNHSIQHVHPKYSILN